MLTSLIQKGPQKTSSQKDTLKILLVIDMQNDFVDGSLGTDEAVAILPAVVEKINCYKAAGGIIIATRDTHQSDYLQSQEGANLPIEHCIEGSDGWKINKNVAAALPENTIYINKPTFASTHLINLIGEYVKQYGEKNIELTLIGLCTDICVVSNSLMLKGFYYEMPIIVDSKACAGSSIDSHKAALTTMGMCQIKVD